MTLDPTSPIDAMAREGLFLADVDLGSYLGRVWRCEESVVDDLMRSYDPVSDVLFFVAVAGDLWRRIWR